MMLTFLSHKGNPSTAFCPPSPIGLITLEELHQQVLKGRGKFAQDVSQDDLIGAIKKLKALGTGFGVIPGGDTDLLLSVLLS